MMLEPNKIREILSRSNKNVTLEELEMLKSWFEKNEELMKYKEDNDWKDTKNEDKKFKDFHMDIYDVIIYNDTYYKK